MITNNDIVFKKGTIQSLIEAFCLSNNVAMTAPSIFDTRGKRTNAPWKSKPTIIQLLGLKSTSKCLYQWSELFEYRYTYMVSGCCFAIDKELFNLVGRFDDNVFLYNEENIISRRIENNSCKIIYCPSAEVIHDHGSTTGNKSLFVDQEFVKSSLYFFSKYEGLSLSVIKMIKIFYIIRITIKACLKRYNSNKGYFYTIKDIIRCTNY